MKMNKDYILRFTSLKVILTTILFICVSNCSLHELPEMEPYQGDFDMTIMEWLPTHEHIITGTNDFTMLIQALEITGLDELLSGTEEYTLFAPGNISWEIFLANNGYDSLNDIPEDELRNILRYHILEGRKLRENFTPTPEEYETLLQDNYVTVNYSDISALGRYYDMIINRRPILTQNIQLNNGVIHAYGMTGRERAGEGDVQILIPQ